MCVSVSDLVTQMHVIHSVTHWCEVVLHLVIRGYVIHSGAKLSNMRLCHPLRYMTCKVPMCFIAFISDRLGYTPPPEVLGESSVLVSQYGWIEGISLLEMEVVRAAFTRHNPNSEGGGGGCVCMEKGYNCRGVGTILLMREQERWEETHCGTIPLDIGCNSPSLWAPLWREGDVC